MSFVLEDRVPGDHLLRKIDRFLDLSTLRRGLAPFYSSIGRPSIDPELMIRMWIVGYCFGIRSERRLCEEVDLNLAYRWFCRLGLEGRVPDHSTFSKTRHGRFRDSDAFRRLFEMIVQRAIAEGLVGGEGFAVDASLIAADANKQRSVASTDAVDWQELAVTRRSVRDYLDKLDEAAWGAASEVVPKFISPSDPAAQWTGAHKGHAFFAYADNYLIDLKAAIIVDVEATRASRRAEVGAARTMLDRTEGCFGLKPQRLSADSAYGSAEILDWLLEEKQIAPHVPVWDKGERADGTFSRSDFVFDIVSNTYTCPGGKILQSITARSRDPGPGSQRTTRGSTEPDNPIVRHVPSRPDAVPDSCAARCREACMRLPARLSGASPARPNISSHVANGRRSRCCSRISSASSDSIAFDCAVHWARRTSSCSRRSHRTCVSWPSWSNCSQQAP
jgi:transposase